MQRFAAWLALTLPFAAAAVTRQTDDIDWHSELPAARELAQQQHKPLFVVFRCER